MYAAILVGLGVLSLDQVTKRLVSSNMSLGESIPAEGWVRITYGVNTGAAFGLFQDHTLLLTVLSVFAIGFLVYFYRAHSQLHPMFRLALGLQLGGAFGNLIDRVRLGSVVDFIDVGPWPIFNVADSAVVTGVALLAFLVFRHASEPQASVPESEDSGSVSGSDPN